MPSAQIATQSGSAAGAPDAGLNDYLAWTFDPMFINNDNGNAPSNATFYFQRMAWNESKLVSSIEVYQGATIGAGMSNAFFYVVDEDGNVKVQTVDRSTQLAAQVQGTVYNHPFSTPAVIPGTPGGLLYAGFFIGASSALPTFGNWGSTLSLAANAGDSSAPFRFGQIGGSNGPLPASFTLTSMVSVGRRWFLGLK